MNNVLQPYLTQRLSLLRSYPITFIRLWNLYAETVG